MLPYAVAILLPVHNNTSAVLVHSFSIISTSIHPLLESVILLRRDSANEHLKKAQYMA